MWVERAGVAAQSIGISKGVGSGKVVYSIQQYGGLVIAGGAYAGVAPHLAGYGQKVVPLKN